MDKLISMYREIDVPTCVGPRGQDHSLGNGLRLKRALKNSSLIMTAVIMIPMKKDPKKRSK